MLSCSWADSRMYPTFSPYSPFPFSHESSFLLLSPCLSLSISLSKLYHSPLDPFLNWRSSWTIILFWWDKFDSWLKKETNIVKSDTYVCRRTLVRYFETKLIRLPRFVLALEQFESNFQDIEYCQKQAWFLLHIFFMFFLFSFEFRNYAYNVFSFRVTPN